MLASLHSIVQVFVICVFIIKVRSLVKVSSKRMLSPFLPCDALLIFVHFDYAWKSLWSKDDFEISQDHRFFWGMFGSFQFSRSPLLSDC